MRTAFAKAVEKLYPQSRNSVFLTGDLGFMALEGVREKFAERFINMGVAEQNMIAFAAGMAYEGFIPWVYSIASFLLLRPFEQIRNDVCLHNLPVKLVGNGGGYGYGIMGATHHVLEDLAVMRVLPNMKSFIPLTQADVESAVELMTKDPGPNYLRLNQAIKTAFPLEGFKQWRKIKAGTKGVVVGVGPIVANILELNEDLEVWAVGILPFAALPPDLINSIKEKKKLLVIEEHAGQCGLNEAIAGKLLNTLDGHIEFRSLSAAGYPSGKYGSQSWHQQESGLAGKALEKQVREWLNA